MSFWFAFALIGLISFAIGWATGTWDRRNVVKVLRRNLEHAAKSLEIRATQLARKEDELEAVEAQLVEANAELVMLRGEGPDAA